MGGIDGGLAKTQKFLANLGSDKYGGDLLPTVISLRELIAELRQALRRRDCGHPPHDQDLSAVHQQVGPEARRPPDDSLPAAVAEVDPRRAVAPSRPRSPQEGSPTCTTRPRPQHPRRRPCSAPQAPFPAPCGATSALDDFEATARRRLPKFLYGYISGGAETDASVRDNRRAFEEYGFVPRVLNDVSGREQTTTLFGKTYAAPFGIPPMGSSALCAYRGDIVLTRAAGRHEPADDSQRLVADHAGGRAARKSRCLVSGLPRRRAVAHRAVGRPRRRRRLRHLCRDRRRAGAAQPREQHPQRFSGAAGDHAAGRLGHRDPSALAVRHLGAHADELRHAAFREHGRAARPAGAGQEPDAQHRPSRPARLEACRADPPPLEGQARGQGPDLAGRCAASRARAASTA